MKGLLIASVVLLALISVSASTEVAPTKLRGPENRNLGLLGLDLNLNVLDLIKVIVGVNVDDPVSVKLALNALNLLKLKLNLALLLLGGAPANVPDVDANLSVGELLKLVAAVDLSDPLSIAVTLKVLDLLKLKLTVPARRNLGLLGLDLNLNVLDLINVLVGVDVSDPASVKLALNALNLLKLKLNLALSLLGGAPASVPDVDANLSVGELLKLVAAVDLSDPLSIAVTLKVLDLLKLKLTVPARRNLGLGDLVNLNLDAEVASLIKAILKLDVNDLASVNLTLNLLQLLEVDLELYLPGSVNVNDLPSDIDVNATVLDLLNIIAKVDLKNVTSVIAAINASELLGVKLHAIVG